MNYVSQACTSISQGAGYAFSHSLTIAEKSFAPLGGKIFSLLSKAGVRLPLNGMVAAAHTAVGVAVFAAVFFAAPRFVNNHIKHLAVLAGHEHAENGKTARYYSLHAARGALFVANAAAAIATAYFVGRGVRTMF